MQTQTPKETNHVLADLVRINNDRIEGYEKALKELKPEDADLKPIFLKAIDQSRKIRSTLGTELQTTGETIPSETTGSGSIYRAWMDVKAVFTGHSRHTVLANCEFGEDAAQKAYNSALQIENLPAYLADVILTEKEELKVVHDEIKALRG